MMLSMNYLQEAAGLFWGTWKTPEEEILVLRCMTSNTPGLEQQQGFYTADLKFNRGLGGVSCADRLCPIPVINNTAVSVGTSCRACMNSLY